ncbi:MAG TPA: class I SAM-dependent rRNA methyltransferase [Acidobacteriaceae bacterium]
MPLTLESTVISLRITRRAADRLREGHLWVYRSDLLASADEPPPGALATVLDNRGAPLGTALYSSASLIAARMVSPTAGLDREGYLTELRARVNAALALRRELAPNTAENDAHRLIFSEADNLPGIVADRYNDLVILQLLTQATAQDDVRDTLVEAFHAGLATQGESLTVWERPDPRIRELEQLGPPREGPLFTTHDSVAPDGLSFRTAAEGVTEQRAASPLTTTFRLNGLRFAYDASAGQKTGAFLDQRLNYAAAARWVAASGRTGRALDVCTYQGGFALHLAQVCDRVTGIDQSFTALEAADRNLALNPHLQAQTDWVEADAFDLLRALDDATRNPARSAPNLPLATSPAFDAIVLDPPAFAKSKRAAEGALRGYKELNLRALRLLAPGGTLITCSCSHHVSLQDFTAAVTSAAADAGRRVQLLETRAAAPDHPEILTLPETRYLKCLICRVE